MSADKFVLIRWLPKSTYRVGGRHDVLGLQEGRRGVQRPPKASLVQTAPEAAAHPREEDLRGVAQRTDYISKIRELAKGSGKIWLESQK